MWERKCETQSISHCRAFVAENQITLGEITVEEKSNEITAVLELLDLLYIEDAIITADSMSCQKKIVRKIADGKADYCVALKENQPMLYQDTADYFQKFASDSHKTSTSEKGHVLIKRINVKC